MWLLFYNKLILYFDLGTSNRSPLGETASDSNNLSISNNQSNKNPSPPVLDFNAELTQHLTLKRRKQPSQQQGNASDTNIRTSRGPPPQPPTQQKQPSPEAIVKKSPPAIPPPPIQLADINSQSARIQPLR